MFIREWSILSDNNIVKISYKELFGEKNFVLYAIANFISRFGDSLDFVAYGWMIYNITNSATLMSILFGVNAIPNIVLQPFTGVLVERSNKKRIIYLCNFGRGVVVSITALMYFLDKLAPIHLFIFTIVNSTFESFQIPASGAIIPSLLDKEKYAYGSAFSATLSRLAELIGLLSIGIIVTVVGVPGAVMIDGLSFLICGFLILFIKIENEKSYAKQIVTYKAFFKELKDGFIYLKQSKIVFFICIFGSLLSILFIPINTLIVPFVKDSLLLGIEAVTLIQVTITIGMAIGSFIFPKIPNKIKGKKIFIFSGISIGISYLGLFICTIIYNTISIYMLLASAGCVFGIFSGILTVQISVTFLNRINKEYISRVSGVYNSIAMASSPLGSFSVGLLCLILNPAQLFLACGLVMIIFFGLQKYNKILVDL